jgi:DNA-binding NarL/FixJ family response regulator
MPRVLVADDHPVVRRHVREMLEEECGWEVCGEAATGQEALTMAGAERPDLVILDLSMPKMNGLQAARQIHAQFPKTEIIILTMHDAQELIDEAALCGARTCILKTDLYRLANVVRGIWESRVLSHSA